MQFNEEKIRTTLSDSSRDDSGYSVIESSQEVYDFDEITKELADKYRTSKPQHSCDALYIKDADHIYLLEFKNARRSRVPAKEVKRKAYDSIMTLQLAFFPQYSLEDIRQKVFLIFIYNNEGVIEKEEESAAFDAFKSKLLQFSENTQDILFGLDIYKGVLYKDVWTIDKTEFMSTKYSLLFS